MPKLWHLPERQRWRRMDGLWGRRRAAAAARLALASSLANLYARWTFSSRPKSCRKFCQVVGGAAHLRFLLRVNKTTTRRRTTSAANKLPTLLFTKGSRAVGKRGGSCLQIDFWVLYLVCLFCWLGSACRGFYRRWAEGGERILWKCQKRRQLIWPN